MLSIIKIKITWKLFNNSIQYLQKRTESTFNLLDSIQNKNILRVYPHKGFCDKDFTICKSHNKDEIYYSDEDHLSLVGGKKLNRVILNTVNQLIKIKLEFE